MMKDADPALMIGLAKHNIYYDGSSGSIADKALADIMTWAIDRYFLDRVRDRQDFVGLNYYFRNRIRSLKLNQNDNDRTNDLGWEFDPAGIYPVLMGLRRYGKPIYITENGLADAHDTQRQVVH